MSLSCFPIGRVPELCPSADCLWQEGFYLWYQCLFTSVFQSTGLFCLFYSGGEGWVHALGKDSHLAGYHGCTTYVLNVAGWNYVGFLLWAALGQWVCLQLGSKKFMLWATLVWTKCCSCKPWAQHWKWGIETSSAVSTSWAEYFKMNCFKINGKTPFGFKAARSRPRETFICIFLRPVCIQEVSMED